MYLLVYIENFNIKIKRYTSFTNIVNKKKTSMFQKNIRKQCFKIIIISYIELLW